MQQPQTLCVDLELDACHRPPINLPFTVSVFHHTLERSHGYYGSPPPSPEKFATESFSIWVGPLWPFQKPGFGEKGHWTRRRMLQIRTGKVTLT
eukprot:720927-Rhodomonas_salina.3